MIPRGKRPGADGESQLDEHHSVLRLIAAWRAGLDSGQPAWVAGYGLRMFAEQQWREPGYRSEWAEGELLDPNKATAVSAVGSVPSLRCGARRDTHAHGAMREPAATHENHSRPRPRAARTSRAAHATIGTPVGRRTRHAALRRRQDRISCVQNACEQFSTASPATGQPNMAGGR